MAKYYALWFGRALNDREAGAIANEARLYADLTATLRAAALFDDEPGNYRHTLAGRRNWRGSAR
jgi:hypothetical protein